MAEVSKPDLETGEPRSILSMHLHAKGIRKYQLTPVAWAGGMLLTLPPLLLEAITFALLARHRPWEVPLDPP